MVRLLLISTLFVGGCSPYLLAGGYQGIVPSSSLAAEMPSGSDERQVSSSDEIAINSVRDMEAICYKIRAYIFKTDDDHAPRLVRETTCMRPRARAKKVDQRALPKLVPSISAR